MSRPDGLQCPREQHRPVHHGAAVILPASIRRIEIQMSTLLELVYIIGSASEQALRYFEHHLWFFWFILFAYLFRLHDRSVHARFSTLDKRVDEIRKRLACDI